MSDEIDIEEHDLLDDPAIKNIFPDLSKLKQEILDYYEEEPELETVSTFETPFISETDNHEGGNLSSSLNVFEGRPLGDFLDNSHVGDVDPYYLTTEKTQVQLFNNKIILATNHEHCNSTSLNVFEDEDIHPGNFLDNSQDNEVIPNHCTTVNTQVQLFNNKIILSTNQEDCNDNTSLNGLGDEGLPPLLDNSPGSNVESQHPTVEKTQVPLLDKKKKLATGHEVCNFSTASNVYEDNNPLANFMHNSQNIDIARQHIASDKTQMSSFNNRIKLGMVNKDKNVITSLNVFKDESLPPDNLLDNSQNSELEPLQLATVKIPVQLFNNKIILGSKPIQYVQNKAEYSNENAKLYSAVVKLVEYGDYLESSSQYCKHCKILFPNQNNFDIHNQQHSVSEMPPVTAVTSSVSPVAFTSVMTPVKRIKRNLIKKKLVLKGNVSKHKCVLCNAVFSCSSNLYRHKRNVHNKTYHPKLTKISKKKNMQQKQSSKTAVKNNECFHCKKIFKDQKSLIEHIYSILQKPADGLITENNKNSGNQRSDVLIHKNKGLQLKNNVKKTEKESKTAIKKNKSLPLKNSGKKAEKGNKPVNQITRTCPEIKSPKIDQGDTFYRCHYCSYYFKQIQFYATHVKNKHQLVKVPKVKKIPFNPKCKFCNSVYSNPQTFNTHLHKRHAMKIKENIVVSKIVKKENQISNLKKATTAIKRKVSGNIDVFRCCYCSHYYINVKCYAKHILRKHKVQKIPKAKKISFDPKCKYCSKISKNIRSYNKHLYRSHFKRLHEVFKITSKDQFSLKKNRVVGKSKEKASNKQLYNGNFDERRNSQKIVKSEFVKNAVVPKSNNFILKSALFKCNKCDIHFLSLKTAVNHSKHMKGMINWKCAVCHKIFKRIDKYLHEKQHTMSNIFTVYEISAVDVPKVLYKCSKCTIHFDELNCMTHCSDCNLKTPQSAYCNVCDILITKTAKKSHEIKHKKFKSIDFIIIEADLIFLAELNKLSGGIDSKLKTNINKVSGVTTTKASDLRKIKKINYFLTQSYCNTCKCFVSILGGTRKVHVQSACSHMTRHTCLECGLTLTNKAMVTHQKLHSIKRDLKLQDYTFYDLRSGKQINPPIPDYHKCEACNIHFISKIIMRRHLCNEKEYKTCQVCEIKLSKSIYHIHMAFHSYSMKKIKTTPLIKDKKSPDISESSIPTPMKFLKRRSIYFVYTCNNCYTTVDTYDKMIQHCQEHSENKNIALSTKECKICNLNIDAECYAPHINLHETIDKLHLEKLNYDLFYFGLGIDIWLSHVFGSRTQEQVKEVIKKSIYQFEHRIKMEIIQEGLSDYTMYKCYKCQCIIEPDNIFKHIDLTCAKLRKYPCSACGLSFISTVSRIDHEKYHERPNFSSKSYRIVLFNCTEDSNIHSSSIKVPQNYYVFYQCRKCGVIDDKSHRTEHVCSEMEYKKCTYCGLSFNNNEYEPHILKHKSLNSFVSENMKVVLFGQNNSDKIGGGNISKIFRGIIYNYNFMRCVNCHICEKDLKVNHICTYDNLRIKCSKCYIYLYSHALLSHLKKHENDPDFEIENMNFIDFHPPKLANIDKKSIGTVMNSDLLNEESHKSKIIPDGTNLEMSDPDKDNENYVAQKNIKIYKCPCGLHFLDEITVGIHLDQCGSKTKQAKQNCFKCGLLFTPKVLFSHVLSHHGDVKNVFKFDIIDVPKMS